MVVACASAPTSLTPSPIASPPLAASPANPPPQNYFGINTEGEVVNHEMLRPLAAASGAQMMRFIVEWSALEKTAGEYSWESADQVINALTENHFEPLILIMNNPAWAANSTCGPVKDLVAYDRFLRALATRYPQVKYWALYNEPDNAAYPEAPRGGCFGGDDIDGNGKRDVEDYAEQLRIAWRAIHESNPDARLLSGALAYDNFDQATAPAGYPGRGQGGIFGYHFLPQLLAYMDAHPLPNGEKYFDVLSFNFYYIYGDYWASQAGGVGVSAKANALNALLRAHSINAPLLVSETGEDSTRVGVNEQSNFLVKTYVRGLASGILATVWWTFQDYPDSAPPPANTWKYGLIDEQAKPKPSYMAFQTITRELTDAQFVQTLPLQGGEAYLFTQDGAGKAVVWSSSEAPVVIPFAATVLHVRDLYGTETIISDGSPQDNDAAVGRIGVGVGPSPVYIQVTAS